MKSLYLELYLLLHILILYYNKKFKFGLDLLNYVRHIYNIFFNVDWVNGVNK